MAREIKYNGKPIESLTHAELLTAIEALCRQADDWKASAESWQRRYEEVTKR